MMRCSAGMFWRSEFNGRHRLDFGAGGAEVEEIPAGEAEHAGEQHGGPLLDAGVVFPKRGVEETAAPGGLLLPVGQHARPTQGVCVWIGVPVGPAQSGWR